MFNINLLSTPTSGEPSPQGSSSPTPVECKRDRDTFSNSQNEFDGKVFGVSLEDSLRVAHEEVVILQNTHESELVPIIIAKNGQYLKENALDTIGIFRIAGSNKRVKELQSIYSKPSDFGRKFEDWSDFNVHDIATLLKRYLNSLSEPLVPLALYDVFRSPILGNPKIDEGKKEIIENYEDIYMLLPQPNRHLILYLVGLLSLFAENEAKNLMPASNLAAIVQPSILSHPKHEMDPREYEVSRTVIEFLIVHASDITPNEAKSNKNTSPHSEMMAKFSSAIVPEMAIDSDDEEPLMPSIDNHMLSKSRAHSDSNNFTLQHAEPSSPTDLDKNGLSVPRTYKGRTLSAEPRSPKLSKCLAARSSSSSSSNKDPRERSSRSENKNNNKQHRQSWLRRLTSPSRTVS